MRRTLITFALTTCMVLPSMAQLNHGGGIWGSHMAKADQLFDEKLYEESIVYYQKELDRFDYNEEAVAKIAEAYMKLGNYKKADDYYTLLFATDRELENLSYMYNYAAALTSTGRYDMAKTWFGKYLNLAPGDTYAKNKLASLDHMEIFYVDSSLYSINTLALNTEKTELGAIAFNTGILFSSSREEDLIIDHDSQRSTESLLSVYFFNNLDSTITRKKLPHHWKSNDGPSTTNDDVFVMTRNNGYNTDLEQNTLGLYFIKEVNGELHVSKPFRYNSPSYSLMHPALNAVGDTLFFSSDMPGGMGKKDLYFSVLEGDQWSQPVNMGSSINTPQDDTFPYSYNGQLYFSSNGLPGLGGHDIYKRSGNTIVNLGYPINSRYDDLAFFMKREEGYLTSNRPGGAGHDDIYHYTYSPPVKLPPAVVSILVTDSLNQKPVPDPLITFLNKSESRPVYNTRLKGTGYYEYQLERSDYRVGISSTGYEATVIFVDMSGIDKKTYEVSLMPDITLDIVNLDSILFDYDDHILTEKAQQELDHIIELMNKYTDLTLNISAYTDSRGEADYNLALSQRRANSTAEYLVEKGIDPVRMAINGYGETQLLNECEDGVRCTESDHMVNRRIEFELKLED